MSRKQILLFTKQSTRAKQNLIGEFGSGLPTKVKQIGRYILQNTNPRPT